MFVKKIKHFLKPAKAHNKNRTVLASLPLAITLALFSFPQTALSASSNTQSSADSSNSQVAVNKPVDSVEFAALTDNQKTTLDAIADDKGLPAEDLYGLFKTIKHEFPNETDIELFELMSEAIEEMVAELMEVMEVVVTEAIEEMEAEVTESIEDIEAEVTEAIEAIEEVTEVIEELEEITEAIEELEEITEAIEELEEITEAIEEITEVLE